ncbi:hypothetical protein K503DRAFT_557880 [Rhizopogon vinicolor AM-OR11-026]|uniref:Uncharacterized protein n=1 Tax=Rhizopogon vinicolor AM-OR11-026 TaxID=1314800 RepID=A0A1B7N801_9AGAM|nr:hypothetical protein K503DRAFT_557880 [Rhizopogon vinicolor AM-OR11-026]
MLAQVQLAVWLTSNHEDALPDKRLLYVAPPSHVHYYKLYLMRFIGQLVARSPRMYSQLQRAGEDRHVL